MKSARGVGTVGAVAVVAQPVKATTTAAGTNQHSEPHKFLLCIIERIVILRVSLTPLIALKWLWHN
jgi:hypothetical protein